MDAFFCYHERGILYHTDVQNVITANTDVSGQVLHIKEHVLAAEYVPQLMYTVHDTMTMSFFPLSVLNVYEMEQSIVQRL